MVLSRSTSINSHPLPTQNVHEVRVISASLFLPQTVHAIQSPAGSDHEPRGIRSPVKSSRSNKTSSMETSGPPSRYLFRSDSDPNRLPFVPTVRVPSSVSEESANSQK